MIIVHHLNNSRSQRILWLLEELGVPYEIQRYQRDPQTRLAPPELKSVHPLGKSPVISDDGRVVIESGAIIDYIIRRHGGGRLQPDPASAAYDDYVQWLHFAEGSAMLPMLLKLYTSRLGAAAAPLAPRIESEIANHLGYMDAMLAGRDYLLGSRSDRRRYPAEFCRRNRRRTRQSRRVSQCRCLGAAVPGPPGLSSGAQPGRPVQLRRLAVAVMSAYKLLVVIAPEDTSGTRRASVRSPDGMPRRYRLRSVPTPSARPASSALPLSHRGTRFRPAAPDGRHRW